MSSTKDTAIPQMEFRENGPIKVSSLENLTGPDGEKIPSRKVIALCRCGRSKNKPFCDGTHKSSGFSDQKTSDGQWDVRVNYVGKKIAIHDNRAVCSHAGVCTARLPAVWRMKEEPWIEPDGGAVDAIIEVIQGCPSGALSYTIDDVEHRNEDRAPAVQATKDGPFAVQGAIAIEGVTQGEGASEEHFALCRCGESKNKPFCDGTHRPVHFKSDNSVKVADLADMKDDALLHVQVEGTDLVVIKTGGTASVLDGKCRHQGALMSDGAVEGENLVCGLHGWTYNSVTGVNADGSGTDLKKFRSWIERDTTVFIDADELTAWKKGSSESTPAAAAKAPSPGSTPEEPFNAYIQELAEHGLDQVGTHGRSALRPSKLGRPAVRDGATAQASPTRRCGCGDRTGHRPEGAKAAAP